MTDYIPVEVQIHPLQIHWTHYESSRSPAFFHAIQDSSIAVTKHFLPNELFDAQSVESASAPNSARSETVSMARGFDAAEETLSVVDIADELPVSPRSDDGQSMHIVYGASVAVSPRSFTSPRIENMGSLLQRWALEHQLDENVASSIRRVLEIPDLIPDVACLTEEEVYALPKVRFTATDTQQCSICLEAFEEGELLTALPCGHFFHVECVAGWMQRATICPLCRASCAD
ncbi:RING-H2 finger protein ATL57 [Symbiodinium microadriaticum]|uniref:RING-H2 finger protein ATL57 n=1 Tax=Symbiodinium microadriaticum TaxID=2951 RepID=A0A1Q9D8Q9_SYMMI|nr:RING-H2 finger protein ATL57 [Symbiodinium microadriaticum]